MLYYKIEDLIIYLPDPQEANLLMTPEVMASRLSVLTDRQMTLFEEACREPLLLKPDEQEEGRNLNSCRYAFLVDVDNQEFPSPDSLSEEKEVMLPLPKRPYEPAIWRQQSVGRDYLISDGLNKYSVPFDLIGEQVQVRLTKNIVEVFFKGSRVTSHKRLESYCSQPVVKSEHMPDNHRRYLEYNADEFKEWAHGIGKSTEAVVKHFLTSGDAPEQGYKDCVSLRKLGSRYGKAKLEAACERMLAFSSAPSVRTIATILKNGKEPNKPTEADTSNKYGITRGAAYWKKGGDGNA